MMRYHRVLMASRATLVAILLATALATACGEKLSSSAQSSTPLPSGAQQINGTERIGWDQWAASQSEIAALRFFAVVDGKSVELTGVACLVSSGTTYACSSALPAMSPGAHSIQVVAFNGIFESTPSTPPLSVYLAARSVRTSSPTGLASEPAALEATIDGVTLRTATLTVGLADVTDLAVTTDGWVFASERAGRIRLLRNGALQAEPAAVLYDTVASGGTLLALAIDSGFSSNHWVYAVHTVARSSGASQPFEFRLTRLTESGGVLRSPAVLLQGIAASSPRPAAALRVGADGTLYAAFDDGGSPSAAGDPTSYNGKLLRLNPDGTTPDDQAGSSPTYLGGLASPRALALPASGRTVWLGQSARDGSERLVPARVEEAGPKRAIAGSPYALPAPFGIGGAFVYTSTAVPAFQGNLFLGSESGRYLLRIQLDAADGDRVSSTERLLVDRVGGIRAAAMGTDGAIYVANATSLFRVSPGGAPVAASGSGLRLVR